MWLSVQEGAGARRGTQGKGINWAVQKAEAGEGGWPQDTLGRLNREIQRAIVG